MAFATASPNEVAQGHAAHTKAADSQEGLSGKITRPINITFLGAGSGFCPNLCRDVLMIPGADRGEFRLVDVDADRLSMMHKVISEADQGLRPGEWLDCPREHQSPRIAAGHRLRRLLRRSLRHRVRRVRQRHPAEIRHRSVHRRHHRAGRTVQGTADDPGLPRHPARHAANCARSAIMLNYTNPMSMMVLSAGRAVPEIPVVGLCHSVQGTSHLLAGYADVPYEEMEWECAGVNHLAWFTKLRHKGSDLYTTVLFDKFAREIAEGIARSRRGSGILRQQGRQPRQARSKRSTSTKTWCARTCASTSAHSSPNRPGI